MLNACKSAPPSNSWFVTHVLCWIAAKCNAEINLISHVLCWIAAKCNAEINLITHVLCWIAAKCNAEINLITHAFSWMTAKCNAEINLISHVMTHVFCWITANKPYNIDHFTTRFCKFHQNPSTTPSSSNKPSVRTLEPLWYADPTEVGLGFLGNIRS